MIKRFIVSFVACVLALLVVACSVGEVSTEEKIEKMFMEMTSYECSANITRISNKGENTYGVRQWYKSSGEYKMEMVSPDNVAGNYTVYDGDSVCQYNPKMNSAVAVKVEEDKARNELFLGQFSKNYFAGEQKLTEEDEAIVLETIIPGDFQYTAVEKLWLDKETLEPIQLIIYDVYDNERYIINYEEFKYNEEIDPNTFKISE